jgi:hypothetical protein
MLFAEDHANAILVEVPPLPPFANTPVTLEEGAALDEEFNQVSPPAVPTMALLFPVPEPPNPPDPMRIKTVPPGVKDKFDI